LPRGDWDYHFGYGYGRDFINFWAAGRLAILGKTSILFDEVAYNIWLKSQFAADIGPYHVYSYPPSIIPLLVPFGALPYGAALLLWTLLHLTAVAVAMRSLGVRAAGLGAALLSPAVAIAAFQGQMSATIGALLFVALAGLDRRPVLSGVLLGVMSLKPQLGIVAGLIVLIERRWLTALAAALAAVTLVATSLPLVGFDGWIDYVTRTVPVHKQFLSNMSAGFKYFLVTPYALFRTLGIIGAAAMAMHLLVAITLVTFSLFTWQRLRHVDRLAAISTTALASLFISPYANLWDFAVAAVPMAAAIAAHGRIALGAPAATVTLWLAPAFALPAAIFAGGPWTAAITVPAVAVLMVAGLPRRLDRAA
jgi:hypothetical protein